MKVVNKQLSGCKIAVSGVGAAGVAIMKLVKLYTPGAEIIACDSKGIIYSERTDLNSTKQALLDSETITSKYEGNLAVAVSGADIFIGVSQPGVLKAEMIATMAKDPVIFALANPVPEVMPDIAKAAGAAVVATGRSDFPNQVNNALAFPGIFRGALDNRVAKITDQHKLAAANVIADFIEDPTSENIIPSIFEPGLTENIANIIQ